MSISIEFMSNHEEAIFSNLIESDMTEAMAVFISALEEDSNYKSVLVSFPSTEKMVCSLSGSPYRVTFCEQEQTITLVVTEYEEVIEELDDNLDEDGAYSIADIICSRPLESEEYVC